MIEDRGVLPPNLIFDTVNIVAVAVEVPPINPDTILAIPCPKISLELECLELVKLSAIRHVNKLSIITKPAKATAGPKKSNNLLKSGMYKLKNS